MKYRVYATKVITDTYIIDASDEEEAIVRYRMLKKSPNLLESLTEDRDIQDDVNVFAEKAE